VYGTDRATARASDWCDVVAPAWGEIVRFNKCLGAFALLLALAASPAHASVIWTEINAGDLLSTAEITCCAGAVTEIDGHLSFDINTLLWDVDLYAIKINSPTIFSARTVAGSSNAADPVLFLFGADGRGVYMNDDTTNIDLQSTLPAGHVSGPLASGVYYLAIAWGFSDPQSASGSIFPVYESSLDPTGIYGATGTGGGDPLSGWLPSGPSNFDVPSDYRILLTAALVAPEPGTLALLALGIVVVAARVRPARSA